MKSPIYSFVALSFALSCCFSLDGNWQNAAAGEPDPIQVDHLNLVFAASDAEKVHAFYGEILGLKRIPNIDIPGDRVMIRYMGGESEIKFIVPKREFLEREFLEREFPEFVGGPHNARGIRLLALMLPGSEQAGMFKRMKEAGMELPEFGEDKSPEGYSYRYGMAFDGDGNQVEIVFLGDGWPAAKFKQIQIGLNVSDQSEMDSFLRDVLGFKAQVTEGGIHRFGMGVSQLKYWKGNTDVPKLEGHPMNKLGMNLVQFLVADVDAVRTAVLERGGKIHTEPFPLGKLATIMFVEGPDGIVFEFAGPLLERFK